MLAAAGYDAQRAAQFTDSEGCMTKTVLIAMSIAMMALGVTTYASGHRTRKSLNVPLLSKHGKFFVGGSLAFFGLGLLVIATLMHSLR
jgi:hypothetical protein